MQRDVGQKGVNFQVERSKFLGGNSHRKKFTARRSTTRSIAPTTSADAVYFRAIP